MQFFNSDLQKHHLFCGDKLWLHFNIFRSILARNAMLLTWSYEKASLRDWREDSGMRQLIGASLPAEAVSQLIKSQFGGLNNALAQIETLFLHEATRVMSGSKAMADSLADVQATMLLQTAIVAQQQR
jgi:hypothetical protein